jgi:hypothetical protein
VVRAPVAVRRDRLRVRSGRELRLAHEIRVPCGAGANRTKEVAVRLLARMRELPLERVHENCGSAVDDRERVAPQPQRQPEPQVRDQQRIRALAREMRRRPGDAETGRVERLAERARPLLRSAQQRLGVRHRRRPGECRRDPARGRDRPQDPPPHEPGHGTEHVPDRRADEALDRVLLVRVAAQHPGQPRQRVDERGADHRDASAQPPLECETELPALRRRRLQQRVRAGCAERRGVGRTEQHARASVQHRLGGAHHHDEIRVDERGVDAHVPSLDGYRDELLRLDVVHLNLSVEAARKIRRHERVDLSLVDAPGEAAGHENRHTIRRDAGPLELVDRDGDRGRPGFDRRRRDGLSRRLDHDRRAPASRDERLERLAREGEAERVAYRGGDVRDRLSRRRRREHDGIVVRTDHGDARSGEKRDAPQGSAR